MNFGYALNAIARGQRVARTGWNGKGLFVYLVPGASYPAQTGAAKAHFGENGMVPYNAYMAVKNVDETVSTWAPSGSDALAQDWFIVGERADLPPHQQRVLEEHAEVSENLAKLESFFDTDIFDQLSHGERGRLIAQHGAMTGYARILMERIKAF